MPGTSDPYLAGMPDGSTANGGDTVPAQTPYLVPGLTLTPGSSLMFTTLAGVVNSTLPDGGTFTSHSGGAENGISDIVAPVNALIGVFLGPDQPDGTPAPATLDFSPSGNVSGGVNYTTLSPLLKQVFFIGDGRTSTGAVQQIAIPDGATRLFLGTMDSTAWNKHSGSFAVSVTPFDPANGPSPLALSTVTSNAGAFHVDYYEPDNSVIAMDVGISLRKLR